MTLVTGPEKGLAGLVGQEDAVRALRAAAAKPVHAYLFVGPPGTGKMAAAMAFAAMLLCPAGGEDGCGTCARAALGLHPDVVVFEREGPFLSIAQAREVGRVAARTSLEGGRKVVILPELHLARDSVPALLKTIEEPPAGTIFVVLADFVPPELVTIASRCAQVDFRPLAPGEVAAALVADGVAPERAEVLARSAAGRLDRARLLASDPEAEDRLGAWASVPARLDGSGATVAVLVDELLGRLERSSAPVVARQQAELAQLAQVENRVTPGPGGRAPRTGGRLKDLEERQRRELRRQRTDELRAGLAALAGAYRDRAVAAASRDGAPGAISPARATEAVALVDGLSADLAYNPGEVLALQALLVRLDRLAG